MKEGSPTRPQRKSFYPHETAPEKPPGPAWPPWSRQLRKSRYRSMTDAVKPPAPPLRDFPPRLTRPFRFSGRCRSDLSSLWSGRLTVSARAVEAMASFTKSAQVGVTLCPAGRPAACLGVGEGCLSRAGPAPEEAAYGRRIGKA